VWDLHFAPYNRMTVKMMLVMIMVGRGILQLNVGAELWYSPHTQNLDCFRGKGRGMHTEKFALNSGLKPKIC
jgi:hypothetical protein